MVTKETIRNIFRQIKKWVEWVEMWEKEQVERSGIRREQKRGSSKRCSNFKRFHSKGEEEDRAKFGRKLGVGKNLGRNLGMERGIFLNDERYLSI